MKISSWNSHQRNESRTIPEMSKREGSISLCIVTVMHKPKLGNTRKNICQSFLCQPLLDHFISNKLEFNIILRFILFLEVKKWFLNPFAAFFKKSTRPPSRAFVHTKSVQGKLRGTILIFLKQHLVCMRVTITIWFYFCIWRRKNAPYSEF